MVLGFTSEVIPKFSKMFPKIGKCAQYKIAQKKSSIILCSRLKIGKLDPIFDNFTDCFLRYSVLFVQISSKMPCRIFYLLIFLQK